MTPRNIFIYFIEFFMPGRKCYYYHSYTRWTDPNLQNIPVIFHKEMEQKRNKQLHTEEYSIEYSTNEQQLICEVISGIFLECSAC